MPKCKNDPKTSYTGKEPSPKGKGFCAKKERIGSKKRGKDGKMWIVKKRIDGVKLWTRFSSKQVNKLSKKKVSKKKIVKKRKYRMKGGALKYDSDFKGMKNNIKIRPAKYLVASIMGINNSSVTNTTTKDFRFPDNISDEEITVYLPHQLGSNYRLTKKLLYDDFTQSHIAIGNPAMTLSLYEHYVRDTVIHNAKYGGLKYIKSTIDGECLMVHAVSIITSCHVRPTIDFDNARVTCLTGNLSEQPDIILLNACGIDNTQLPDLTHEEIQKFLGYYNNALIEIINKNEITHLCLVQIGLGVFAGNNVCKKNLITEIYATGILSLKAKCPSLEYIFLPDKGAKFFDKYHESFKGMGLMFEITIEDALGKAFELKKKFSTKKVAYLNPSDSVVIFGSYPVGALCMTGTNSGFVGEEFVGQSTTGIFFNSTLLFKPKMNTEMKQRINANIKKHRTPIRIGRRVNEFLQRYFGFQLDEFKTTFDVSADLTISIVTLPTSFVGLEQFEVSITYGHRTFPVKGPDKKYFIKTVCDQKTILLKNSSKHHLFICLKDQNSRPWGDIIIFDGTEYQYYDMTRFRKGKKEKRNVTPLDYVGVIRLTDSN